MAGQIFCIRSWSGRSRAVSERNSKAPGNGCEFPKMRTSSSRSVVAIAPSNGAGSNFFPVISVSWESARE
jgi:hypothetical protein